MRICGISFEAANAVAVIIESLAGEVSLVETEVKRIPLSDHEDSDCLKGFLEAAKSFVHDHSVDAFAIRKCTYAGKFRSGAAALKMEALLQVSDVNTELLSAQTVTARCRSSDFAVPGTLNKYQHDAFKVAFALASHKLRG